MGVTLAVPLTDGVGGTTKGKLPKSSTVIILEVAVEKVPVINQTFNVVFGSIKIS